MNKQELRTKYLTIRKDIVDKKKKSLLIMKKVIATSLYEQAQTIALYKNLSNEVDTNDLIKKCLEDGKVVALPRVTGDDLIFFRIDQEESYIKSSFGVLEPEEESSKIVLKENIDLIIVPGVCFDLEHNRLGFGKGFYDRYLEGIEIPSIAICFDEQILKDDLVPTNDNDMKVKLIISDKRMI